MVFIQDIIDSYCMKLVIDFKSPKMNNFRSLFNYDVNICEILGVKGNPGLNLLSTWMQNTYKHNTMPSSCSIRQGSYGLQDFKVDKNSIPAFAMNGMYRIKVGNFIKGSTDNINLLNLTLIVEVKTK
ncbi:uncharacterized protein LOC131995823 [Stomoxys calcitrans]|uniref:uncharacterized protein LOC131995823 n=1 Tax=Stomoxys calcitrans TaxID=35570 RepID=UPI0027E2E37B|nr:uncharacterized protein LOC131995823 [Stomoxys calcitrans]